MIQSRSKHLIEDCAQAHGSEIRGKKVGTFGDIGCFSFYPTKNLGALGDGGALVTNNAEFATRSIELRQYGWDSERISRHNSTVSRLDEIQAAILSLKLLWLDKNNARRSEIARFYQINLISDSVQLPKEPLNGKHVYHLYVIRVPDRQNFIKKLNRLEIFPGIHYPKPVHLHPAFHRFAKNSKISLEFTENLAKEIVSLPMYPELSDYELNRIAEGVKSVR